MPRIRALEPLVINQIAAGEVIERPASVVKELLENSLDALATRVEVDIGDGGAELVRIVDDGEGIHPDDLLLAVTSHATSKIQHADDLFRIHTMGFRGEALASIASVSRMRLRSRQPDAESGYEIEVVGGQVGPIQPCGCPVGTSIEVRQLFLNTPVRRKFLKSAPTEFGHISEIFTRIALANPRLHGVLKHNGRTVYELPPTAQLLDRLKLFFGGEVANQLIPIQATAGDIRVWGYVGHPDQTKATRKSQYLFLNGRYIQDRSLQHAFGEAYRGLVMVGRHPICFLFLEAPPDSVDVNVHPTKAEVRFQDSQSFYRLLLATIRSKFLSMDLGGTMRLAPGGGAAGGGSGKSGFALTPTAPRSGSAPLPLSESGGTALLTEPSESTVSLDRQRELQLELAAWANEQLDRWSPDSEPVLGHIAPPSDAPARDAPGATIEEDAEPGSTEFDPFAEIPWREGLADAEADTEATAAGVSSNHPLADGTGRHVALAGNSEVSLHGASESPAVAPAAAPLSAGNPHVSPAGRVMQVHDCYLILETPEGVQLIDQHALHERILYEQLRRRVLAGSVEAQRLLVPITLELTAAETVAVLENRDVLAQLGYGIDDFGGTTVLLNAYPTMLRKADHAQLLRDLAEKMVEAGRKPTRRDMLDSMLHTMSCRAAIKSGQRLTPEEMDALLAQRSLVEDSHHCPHGRPTSLDLSREELDRQFGRLGADR
ncbi:MAG: DNA mismatch repair endonuclease MutL [Planctomycetaceae bacterium]|nr:DNA mismatch repair endonuclease MutL [Planctomycetaceae bacterium]